MIKRIAFIHVTAWFTGNATRYDSAVYLRKMARLSGKMSHGCVICPRYFSVFKIARNTLTEIGFCGFQIVKIVIRLAFPRLILRWAKLRHF